MFKIVSGGLSKDIQIQNPCFISSYVTDTRLMGVVAVFARWDVVFNETPHELFQFFRFDYEEYGFEAYDYFLVPKNKVPLNEEDKVSPVKQFQDAHIDVLGGNHISINEKALKHLLHNFVSYNNDHGIPLPPQERTYQFILDSSMPLSPKEEQELSYKMCTPVLNEYQVINYFLMRIVGKDFSGARLLTKHPIRMDIFYDHKAGILLRNSIDEETVPHNNSNSVYYAKDENKDFSTFTTRKSYVCNSLITYDNKYFVLISHIVLEGLRVVKAEKISSTKISDREAAIIQREREFVSFYEMKEFDDEDNSKGKDDAGEEFFNLIETLLEEPYIFFDGIKPYTYHLHEAGRLYMVFNRDNRHVAEKVYCLGGDVRFNFIITELGDIILSSASKEILEQINCEFVHSTLGKYFNISDNFEFLTSVTGLFLDGEIYDFKEFIDFISVEYDGDDDFE